MGALTVPQSLDKVARQIEDARRNGATVITGGNRISRDNGFFFEPTIIGNATTDMLVASEETFGPLLALFPFDTEEEAVKAANNTSVSFFFFFFFFFSLSFTFFFAQPLSSGGQTRDTSIRGLS